MQREGCGAAGGRGHGGEEQRREGRGAVFLWTYLRLGVQATSTACGQTSLFCAASSEKRTPFFRTCLTAELSSWSAVAQDVSQLLRWIESVGQLNGACVWPCQAIELLGCGHFSDTRASSQTELKETNLHIENGKII